MSSQKITIYLSILILLGICVYNAPVFVYGQPEGNEASMLNREIKSINDDITNKRADIKRMQDKQQEYTDAIKQRQSEKASLNNQLAILDNRVAKAELDIELVETDIERVKLEIQKTDLAIKEKNKEIAAEREHIGNVLRLMYRRDNISSLEIILLNDSLSDFLSQVRYLEDISENLERSLDGLEKLSRQLEKEKKSLNEQDDELAALRDDFVDKKSQMENELDTKIYVLDQVARSEKDYQRLLAQAKKEQEDAAAEIASFEKLVRAKVAALEGNKLDFNDNGIIWPVSKNIITSYFHDPDYPFRYIFEHPAVDIRAAQGTPLKAAASGYVARAKYGTGGSYGYIMIIHGDGLATVYGHVSKILVEDDEYVVQGQTIGQSGGMPGTPGAGRLTTGPHLHFEVRLNGIPVDPLAYLP